jgi:putative glutamine amidotransferase
MPPRIAIPVPHSGDPEYAERALPQYLRAIEMAGGEPVRIPLDQTPAEATKLDIMKMIESCDAVLLPGSKADVDPAKFGVPRSPHTAAADPRRDAVDELLLQDAYDLRKPILGICYGLQILNVFRNGSLIQHIPDFLPEDLRTRVNHEAGSKVAVAHVVEILPESELARIIASEGNAGDTQVPGPRSKVRGPFVVPVNSSHHQSADLIGDGLRLVARCPDDGIIEALEGTSPDHFVLAVQWHPERSGDDDEPSRAIFRALIEAARERHQKLANEAAKTPSSAAF